MFDLPAGRFANRLLSALSPEDIEILAPLLEPTVLELRQPIETAGQTIEHLYFVETGMISVVARKGDHHGTEVGMIGKEGVTGCAVALGDDVPSLDTFVQISGRGVRVPLVAFKAALCRQPKLKSVILSYARVLWIRATSTALANVNARLEARLARWLLMMHDRMDSDHIDITHEFLALMLHSRRPGVTVALHVLEGEHLIASRRGRLTVKDRDGLIQFAAGTYGWPETEYDRLIGIAAA